MGVVGLNGGEGGLGARRLAETLWVMAALV